MKTAHVLDDDATGREALAQWLSAKGFEVTQSGTIGDARTALSAGWPDLLVLDLQLPDGEGTDLLDDGSVPVHTQVLVVTGEGTIDSAVSSIQRGVADYLTKPVNLDRLNEIVANVSRTSELRGQVSTLRRKLRELGRYGRLVGRSEAMQSVYDVIEQAAPSDASVFITGETGTGKEVVARTLHDLSPRHAKPFVAVNCGAIAENLVESELFGHEKGSFTGALRQHRGVFEQADGGTLFLDELAEMPVALQVRLLRVLETKEVRRVGGSASIAVNARVIAATNRDPAKAVAENELREDLMYRLMVVPITVPPLRERRDDVPLLADFFLVGLRRAGENPKRLQTDAIKKLAAYDWPGNVRELRNVLERSCLASGDVIRAGDIPLMGIRSADASEGRTDGVLVRFGTSLEDAQKALILRTLEWLNDDRKATAEALEISPKTLYNRLMKYREDESD